MKRLALVLALVAAGCRDAEPAAPMSRDAFIDVIVALREANRETGDPEVFYARKQQILEEAGVTDSALVEFARFHADDAAFMAATWDSIARRLRSSDTLAR